MRILALDFLEEPSSINYDPLETWTWESKNHSEVYMSSRTGTYEATYENGKHDQVLRSDD